MEKSVENVFSSDVVEQLLHYFKLDSKTTKLGDFENYVFEVQRDSSPYILRITHSSHRDEEEILSEIDWVNYLHENGVNVPKVFLSRNAKLIEKIEAQDGTCFYGCLFSKANGKLVKPNDELFNEKLFFHWGKETGKMHRLTKVYQPKLNKRSQWFDDDLLEIDRYVPTESRVIEQSKKLFDELDHLPQTKENYGLIHNDIHHGNFFYDGKSIDVFDFDDCCYYWYASDIAIPLYYACMAKSRDQTPNENEKFAELFLREFMNGYLQETKPPVDWKNHLTLFLHMRDITLYVALNKKTDHKERNDTVKEIIKQLKRRIENREPIVAI
ncbi:phosphotransferase enzyme family protein [Virgibacillus ndiopensis]|uniref:phosphotransferase enzyme family protein n=1 Tax=Virgibacillus ndiopensis TaxID=2004408 RepID=UPI000C0779D4|nr:phosphotransferase [Virgibacillus ndiopensis]